MNSTLAEIEAALATVQSTLDLLSTRGEHEAAFEIARAQYVASIRASWPQNLGALIAALDHVQADPSSKLDEQERARIRVAVTALRRAVAQ